MPRTLCHSWMSTYNHPWEFVYVFFKRNCSEPHFFRFVVLQLLLPLPQTQTSHLIAQILRNLRLDLMPAALWCWGRSWQSWQRPRWGRGWTSKVWYIEQQIAVLCIIIDQDYQVRDCCPIDVHGMKPLADSSSHSKTIFGAAKQVIAAP